MNPKSFAVLGALRIAFGNNRHGSDPITRKRRNRSFFHHVILTLRPTVYFCDCLVRIIHLHCIRIFPEPERFVNAVSPIEPSSLDSAQCLPYATRIERVFNGDITCISRATLIVRRKNISGSNLVEDRCKERFGRVLHNGRMIPPRHTFVTACIAKNISLPVCGPRKSEKNFAVR